ncbi:MAG: hypothetical protein GY854_07730 [Deltaproteobacteria bacterium]|nr:hypothetical protein [Deltaproteobacteria bacterium]
MIQVDVFGLKTECEFISDGNTDHTCAINSSGKLKCWGSNNAGNSSTATQVGF